MRRRIAVLLSIVVCSLAAGLMAPAMADSKSIDVNGTLADTRTNPAKPVPGVSISIDEGGKEIGKAVSDAEGNFSITLPGTPIDLLGKTITVKLDTDTLPKGADLRDPKKTSYKVLIKTDANIRIGYAIGPAVDNSVPIIEQVGQSGVNGIFLGLLLALAALGLSLVFGTTGLTNFAHGELITFGALAAFFFQDHLSWTFLPAAAAAIVLSAVFGLANDKLLWKPLRGKGTGLIAMMIVSIGLSIFLRNVYQYFFGADNHQYTGVSAGKLWNLGSVGVSPKSFYIAVVCVIVLVAVSLAVQKTRLGKATRAVSDNPALAASSGIDVDRVISTIWIVGAGLAGMSGIMWGLTNGFDYQVGNKILLLVFAAVTLGGLGTIWGTMVGSIIVGLLVEMSSIILPAELKYVTALVVLVLILLVRPQGLLGRAVRVG
ncbi:MAG: branched-chain amino acid transport system permease protein [Nocardioidaceae bacterium]|nr:branched-chain amino acid transport system permease protein [Nocardioidaceae bacterium]